MVVDFSYCSEGSDHMGTDGVVTIDEEKEVGFVVCHVHLETDQANASQHIQ